MGMVVRSNIMALNANRQLGMNNSQVSKSLEKLSSGYKINRAGDDASGLAISEKMKAQIKGLETASANSQDGISLVQTAEGALTEVHDMLNRMVELAGKAANGTIDSETDRAALQDEMNSLLDEIDRIAQSTDFNGIKLLDGSLAGGSKSAPKVEVISGDAVTDFAGANGVYTTANLDTAGTSTKYTVKFTVDGKEQEVTVDFTDNATAATAAGNAKTALDAKLGEYFDIAVAGDGLKFTAKDSNIVLTAAGEDTASNTAVTVTTKPINAGVEFGDALAAGDVLKIDGKTYTIGGAANEEKLVFASGADLATYLKKNGYDLITEATGASANDFAADTILVKTGEGGLSLQIGATGDEYNKVTVSVGDMSSKGLGINNLRDTGIMTQDAASAALDQIKNGASSAINMVSSQRAELGAMQNRLEHTINNLDVAAENMESANSQIRDTDMAKEMMEYTKQNVLTQAAQAMLAQANQQPQSILQLLQ